ncbi:hypothetical protein SpCBS45565_g04364 [Spizellomyces sp. 'palustris']|nr:hypothetical protein SpCBS45565_g04364 [Spizellomyces sp. 'palustris']
MAPLSSLPLTLFSASKFAGTRAFQNKGAGDVQVLHSCDKCAFVKNKYLLASELAMAAANHLFPSKQASRKFKTISVAFENRDNVEVRTIRDFSSLDPAVSDVERTMMHQYSVFMHLLWKYNLISELNNILTGPKLCEEKQGPGDWKRLSFAHIRAALVKVFSHAKQPLQLNHRAPLKRPFSMQDLSGLSSHIRGIKVPRANSGNSLVAGTYK